MRCCGELEAFRELGLTHHDVAHCWARAHGRTHFGSDRGWFDGVVTESKDAVNKVWSVIDDMYDVYGVLRESVVPDAIGACGDIAACTNEDGSADDDKVAEVFGPLIRTLVEDPRAHKLSRVPVGFAEVWANSKETFGMYAKALGGLRDAKGDGDEPRVGANKSMEDMLGRRAGTSFGASKFRDTLVGLFKLVKTTFFIVMALFVLVLAYCYTVGMHDTDENSVCNVFWRMYTQYTGHITGTSARLSEDQARAVQKDLRLHLGFVVAEKKQFVSTSAGGADGVYAAQQFKGCDGYGDLLAKAAGVFRKGEKVVGFESARGAATTFMARNNAEIDAATKLGMVPGLGAVLGGARWVYNAINGNDDAETQTKTGFVTGVDNSNAGQKDAALAWSRVRVGAREDWASVINAGYMYSRAHAYAHAKGDQALRDAGKANMEALMSKGSPTRAHIEGLLKRIGSTRSMSAELDDKDSKLRGMLECVDRMNWQQTSWWSIHLSSFNKGLFECIGDVIGINPDAKSHDGASGESGAGMVLIGGVLVFALLIGYYIHPLAAGAVVACLCVGATLYKGLTRTVHDQDTHANRLRAWWTQFDLWGKVGTMTPIIVIFGVMMLWGFLRPYIPMGEGESAYMDHVGSMLQGAGNAVSAFRTQEADSRRQSDAIFGSAVGSAVGAGVAAVATLATGGAVPVVGVVGGGLLRGLMFGREFV
jgi:hypothetical protein